MKMDNYAKLRSGEIVIIIKRNKYDHRIVRNLMDAVKYEIHGEEIKRYLTDKQVWGA